MTEILFYHMRRQALEEVLPTLLEKTLARGWRAVVQVRGEERAGALDGQLWTYRDDSFLPHVLAEDANAADTAIVIATEEANPNGAKVCFLVDGAETADAAAYERLVVLFAERDPEAVAAARDYWRRLKAAGHEVTYWQETERGGWERKA